MVGRSGLGWVDVMVETNQCAGFVTGPGKDGSWQAYVEKGKRSGKHVGTADSEEAAKALVLKAYRS